MFSQFIASEFVIELSCEQQELLAGGYDFEKSNSNFFQRNTNVRKTSNSSPQGESGNSTFQDNETTSSAQDLFSPTKILLPGITGLSSTGFDTPNTSFSTSTN